MYDKVCVVCDKPFKAINSRYKTCSAKCRIQYDKDMGKIYAEAYRNRRKFSTSQYIKVEKHCKICNALLPHGGQKYCLKCLVNGYIKGDKSFRRNCMHILQCRGYSVDDVREEAKVLNLV